ncbi:adenosylcobinamide-phosphate synthase CbiB [Devosia sp. 1566]|uniref:adenosylcobinamide-phosphate synthase CbiB n=1 Tax=Devosia sp. 1566 TaxID=2499144 RepID=UPI000FDBE8AE|nr:adenosylcobinamide-phosphate synthase CbiB [Devosia sp. 1566]
MTPFLIAPIALLLERWLGYPDLLLRALGHPVMWFGRLIAWLDNRADRDRLSPEAQRRAGVVGVVVLLLATLAITLPLQLFLRALPFGWLAEALLATPFLAQKELGRAVNAVALALDRSLAEGREAVSHIVGRDPEQLDEAGVARAAVETLGESTSDGVVAPLFWLLIAGLPGIALYKAINTADSMIGHLNERHRYYGWAAARLDDLVNWIPARLTAVLIVLACRFVPGASAAQAWATMRRDARKHASPNSGWPETAFAGALGFALGGPRAYGGEVVDLPLLGSGKRDLDANDIRHALALYRATLNVLLAACLVLLLLGWLAD